jgi:hypothetical protein
VACFCISVATPITMLKSPKNSKPFAFFANRFGTKRVGWGSRWAGLLGVLKSVSCAIRNQRIGHVDRVVPTGQTDDDLDTLTDRLFLANAA